MRSTKAIPHGRLRRFLAHLIGAALICLAIPSHAQLLYFSVAREQWHVQLSTNAVPFAYRFSASVSGNGLVDAWTLSPSVSNALSGGSFQMSFTTNFPAVSLNGTNIAFNTNDFDQLYPVGEYKFGADYKSVITASRSYAISLTNDFAETDPVILDPTPLSALQSVQTFSWPAFSAQPMDYCRFVVLEGSAITTNMISEIMTNGIDSLTNELTVLYWDAHIPSTNNSVVVTNLNPVLSHLTLLEFHRVCPVSGTFTVPNEASSISIGLAFFYGLNIYSQPADQTVAEGNSALFSVQAVGTMPLSYQWYFNSNSIVGATNLYHGIPSVQQSDAGFYSVVVSNAAGTVTSTPALLTVTSAQPIHLAQPHMISSNGVFGFIVYGDQGASYEVLSSTNLTTWSPAGVVSTPLGTGYFSEAAMGSERFYRVRFLTNSASLRRTPGQ